MRGAGECDSGKNIEQPMPAQEHGGQNDLAREEGEDGEDKLENKVFAVMEREEGKVGGHRGVQAWENIFHCAAGLNGIPHGIPKDTAGNLMVKCAFEVFIGAVARDEDIHQMGGAERGKYAEGKAGNQASVFYEK